MNLIISQAENTQESNVPSSVVEKLYNLAFTVSGGVVVQSQTAPTTLVGTIGVSGGTYEDYVTRLESAYSHLHINAPSYYIRIEDSVVRTVLSTLIGDGTGVTQTNIDNTSIETLAGANFNGATKFYEFEKFAHITQIPNNSNIDLKTINKVKLPCSKFYGSNSVKFNGVIYELICPNLTQTDRVFGDAIGGIFYIGGSTFDFSQSGEDYPMCRIEDGTSYVNVNKMLYLPKVTDITFTRSGGCDSCFGSKKWRPNTPWKIVYIKGTAGQKTNIQNKIFEQCDITNLIINNTVLPDINNGLLNATNVYVPSDILTSSTSGGVTTYSLSITDPWAAASKYPVFKPISEFPKVATLAAWEDEGMPVKLVEALM